METPEKKSTEEVCAEIRHTIAVEDARKALRWNVGWLAFIGVVFICFLIWDDEPTGWGRWTMWGCFFANPIVGIVTACRTLNREKRL